MRKKLRKNETSRLVYVCLVNDCFGQRHKKPKFLVGRLSRANTFRVKCVNPFQSIYVPKVRNLLLQQTCKSAKNFSDYLETFETVIKLLKLSRKFSDCTRDCLESFRLSGNFSDCPETFHTLRKLSYCSETFQTVLKVSE